MKILVCIILAVIAVICLVAFTLAADDKNSDKDKKEIIQDQFEEDEDLRFAADTFCHDRALADPSGKVVLPYKPDCHFWWQCTAYELKKMECQGLHDRIRLHYDLYLDRCELPASAKCNYIYDEEEITMEAIMEYYKKDETKE